MIIVNTHKVTTDPIATTSRKNGSERKSVSCPIFGRILQFHGFGPASRHVLSFQEQVAQVPVAAATPDDRLDVAVDGLDYPENNLYPAVVE